MELIFILLGIILLICLCFIFIKPKMVNKEEIKMIYKQDEIFVVLPRYLNSDIIDRIFLTASFPLRVYIGVGSNCTPQPNVRCLKTMQPFGNSIARQEIIKNLYLNETYILCINECSFFLKQGWDEMLILNIKENQVLSYWASEERLNENTTFPIFDEFVAHLPKFKPCVSKSILHKPFEIGFATFDCVFGKAKILKDFLELGLPYLGSMEENLLLSFHLFNKNIQICTPESHVLLKGIFIENEIRGKDYKQLRKITFSIINHLLFNKPIPSNEKLPLYILNQSDYKKTNIDFFNYLGIDITNKTASGKARFGLFGNYSDAHILARFESLSNFHDLKNKMNFIS